MSNTAADRDTDNDLVIALDQARQRIEALKQEFGEATNKLAVINSEIKTATDRYSLLQGLNAELEGVNRALEVATGELTAINKQIIVAQFEVESLQGAKKELVRVNEELTKATTKLAAVSKELKEATAHVVKLQEAKLGLESLNAQVTGANKELAGINRELQKAHAQAIQDSKLKTEFLANISHEIRTPMSGMISMCELLLLENLDEQPREMARDIMQASNTLLLIVNQLLDFSKLEAGKMEPERIQFSIAAVLERVASVMHPEAVRKGLGLQIAVDPAIPAVAVGDGMRVEKILLNLVHNAVKFSENGEIRIAAEVLSQSKPRFTVRISVTDTGIGIAEQSQTLLFEPFVQANGSTTRKYGGTGLGLSIAKRLVTLLSGEIGVDSTAGQGSTFWFSLPLEYAD